MGEQCCLIDKFKKVNNYLFWSAYIIAIIASVISRSFLGAIFNDYFKYMYVSSWFLLFVRELLLIKFGYSTKEYVGVFFCGILLFVILISVSLSGVLVFGLTIPLVFSSRNIEFGKIAKITAITETILLICIIVLALLGIINNVSDMQFSDEGILLSERARYYIGFLYPLFPMSFATNITLLFLYLKKETLKSVCAVALFGGNAIIFIITGSRYGFVISTIAIVFCWLYSNEYIKLRNVGWLKYGAIVSFVVSFVSAAVYSDKYQWMIKLSNVLGNRIRLASEGFANFGLHLISRNVYMNGYGLAYDGSLTMNGEYNWVDNAWMNVLFQYGIIIAASLIILYTVLLRYLYINGLKFELVLLQFVFVQMLLDDCNIMFYWNTFILMIGKIVIDRNRPFDRKIRR